MPILTNTPVGRNVLNGLGTVANTITGTGTSMDTNPFISSMNEGNYNYKFLKFPEDLDDPQNSYYGHAMMININVPEYSIYEQTARDGRPVSIYNDLPHQINQSGMTRNYTVRQNQYSRIETLRRSYDTRYTGAGPLGSGRLASSFDIPGITQTTRRTRRITESILLYMPGTVNFVQANAYEDFSFTELLKKVGVGAAQGVVQALGSSPSAGAAQGLASGATSVLSGAAGMASKLNNAPINPRIEVIYTSPMVRQFDFTFDLAPSNERESVLIDNIIRTLRFHAAPELSNRLAGTVVGETLGGLLSPFFLTPPAEFDITFFHKGKENTVLPRINTCVLQNIDLDYAPNSVYTTFSNGHPVHIRMRLSFKEIEVIDKKRVLQGF